MRARACSGAAAVVVALAAAASSGCATLLGGQQTTPTFVDDAAITSTVEARMAEDPTVDAKAIRVETLHGNVTLSGAARDRLERQTAENIAIKVRGVKTVRNEIAVQP